MLLEICETRFPKLHAPSFYEIVFWICLHSSAKISLTMAEILLVTYATVKCNGFLVVKESLADTFSVCVCGGVFQ